MAATTKLEAEYDKIFAICREGVVRFSLDRLVERSNPAATLYLGYSAAELEGRDVASLVYTDDRLRIVSQVAEVIAGKSEASIQQARVVAKFGLHTRSWFNIYPVHFQGQIIHLVAVLFPVDGYQTEELLTAIQKRIEQLEIVLEHHQDDDKVTTTVHIGDYTGGDKAGRDKHVNSTAIFRWIAGTLVVIAAVLAWIAYYIASRDRDQDIVPPDIPGINRDAEPTS